MVIANIFLLILMTFSLFFFMFTYGQYKYLTQTYRLINNADINNSLYFSCIFNPGTDITETIKIAEKKIKELDAIEKVQTCKVSNIKYNDLIQTLVVINSDAKQLYPKLSQGKWPETDINDDGSINAVVHGYSFYNVKIGTNQQMYLNDKPVTIHITGILNLVSNMPEFGSSGSRLTTDKLYKKYDAVILNESSYINNLVNIDNFNTYPNFIISIKDNTSEKELKETEDTLTNLGTYIKMSEILENTQQYIKKTMSSTLILPIFFLIISFVSFISISVLIIYKRIKTRSIFYLMGCSKRRMVFDTILQVGIISFISGGINIVLATNYEYFYIHNFINLGDKILFDSKIILLMLGIILFYFLFATLVSLLVLSKKAPLDVIREFQN